MTASGTAVFMAYLRLLRPHQWVKNGFIFLPLVFSQNLGSSELWYKSVFAFLAFSFISSGIYIINDLRDREEDRFHPEKSLRPLASGKVRPAPAAAQAFIVLLAGLLLAGVLPALVYLPLLAYLALQVLYTFLFKRLVILDALAIAVGFVLRVVAGALAITVPMSSWLLLCTFFLALFLAFCKRRNELGLIDSGAHRRVLEEYSEKFLDQLITTSAAITILCYALYASSPVTAEKFHTPWLVLTVPFVAYGVYRYQFLVLVRNRGGNPVGILFGDRPFALNFALWMAAAFAIVYWEVL
jgi:4-hydroxybenzoate polyprenyltransferase